MRILVVEDDPTIAQVIEAILHQHKYAVDLAADGEIGLGLSESYEYDVILLDISLPKRDGVSVCRQIRATGNSVPILLLTALDSPADRTRGLDAGADDYLGKPFDTEELLARIRALLRRSHTPSAPVLTWDRLQLNPISATVTYADRPVAVTPKEYALLELFLRNSKRVFSCNAILDNLWAYDETPGEEAIRTHIKGLRQKLKLAGADPDFVETVYGIGYRLKPINPPAHELLVDAWEKFKDQVHEQVAVLERLSIRFLNNDLQSDWQTMGQKTAHSLAVSLRTFGFSLSSELARQIEKLLSGHQSLTVEQGQRLFSVVAALQEELNQPISITDIHCFESDTATNILLVSEDDDLNQQIQSVAIEQGWCVQVLPTITAARSQLQQRPTRSILLAPKVAEQTAEVLHLLIEVSKYVPPVPIILLTDCTSLQPEMDRLGTCMRIPPMSSAQDIIKTIKLVIATVDAGQTHVLVVDDDLKVLAILQALLVPWGLKVTTLSDPQRFWAVLNQAQPDLLILDVEMPTLSGLELCQVVRNQPNWSQLPIICLTSHLEPNLIQQVFATGANDFVMKPVIGPEIISRITNLTERHPIKRLKITDHHRTQLSAAKSNTSHKIQSILVEIEHSLYSLQHDMSTTPSKETYQLCDQFNQLRQLLQMDC